MINNSASVKGFRYGIPALITAAPSLILLTVISGVSAKSADITAEAVQLICALVSLVGLLDCIRRNRGEPIFRLAAEALACFVLGELYWVLHICIKDHEQDGVFSISDISWLAFYLFLLTACRSVFNHAVDFREKKYRKTNVLSLFAPLLILAANVALYLSGDSLFYTVIYAIPTAFLSFYTLRCILVSFADGALRSFRAYHVTVGLILLLDNLTCLALDNGFQSAEYIFKCCFAVLILCITPAVYKGVREWRR